MEYVPGKGVKGSKVGRCVRRPHTGTHTLWLWLRPDRKQMKRCSCATARLCRRPNSFSFPCNSLLYFSASFFFLFSLFFLSSFFCLCCAHFFLCSLINCLASVSVSRDAAAVAACCMVHGKLPASWASQRQSMQAHTHTLPHTRTHQHKSWQV